MTHIHGVILDVDGTLVDSNDAQAQSWAEAMADYGYYVSPEKIRPLIGMGGDKVLPATLGMQKDTEDGQKISARRKHIFFQRFLPSLHPFPGAKELIQYMREHGLNVAVASSAESDELRALLDLVGASDLIEEKSSSQDAPQSKPDPDIVSATLHKMSLPTNEVLMLGDTPYDIEAAGRAGIYTIALRCGGWDDTRLSKATAIYNDPADLLQHYDTSPLGQ